MNITIKQKQVRVKKTLEKDKAYGLEKRTEAIRKI